MPATWLQPRPCLSCLGTIEGLQPGQPPICAGCWPSLTLAERSRLVNDERASVALHAILAMLQGNRETEELTRLADRVEKSVKQQEKMVATIAEVLGWIKERIERGGDGEEFWRGGEGE